jgi:hypothetical protein
VANTVLGLPEEIAERKKLLYDFAFPPLSLFFSIFFDLLQTNKKKKNSKLCLL